MTRWLAGVALGVTLTAGCAAAIDPAPPVGRDLPEDAMTGFFAEQEVDEPARPLAPISPRYPPTLRRLGVEGSVTARVAVRRDGSVGAATLLSSTHPGFTAAARDALREARFEPARRAGRAVASWIRLEIGFELER